MCCNDQLGDELSWLFTKRFRDFFILFLFYKNFCYLHSLNFYSTLSVSQQPTQLIIEAHNFHNYLQYYCLSYMYLSILSFLYLQRNIHGWLVFICFGSWKPSPMYYCIWRRSIHTTRTRQTTKFILYLLLHCYKCWHADNWLHFTSFKVNTLLYFWLSCLIFYNSLDQIYWTKSIGPNPLDQLDYLHLQGDTHVCISSQCIGSLDQLIN